MRTIAVFFLGMVIVFVGLGVWAGSSTDDVRLASAVEGSAAVSLAPLLPSDIARLFHVGAFACVMIAAPALIIANRERAARRWI